MSLNGITQSKSFLELVNKRGQAAARSDLGVYGTSEAAKLSGGNTFIGDQVVYGNITLVNGALDELITNTLNVNDQFITVNSAVTGSPILDGGIIFNRGSHTASTFMWNESTDTFDIGYTNGKTVFINSNGAISSLIGASSAGSCPSFTSRNTESNTYFTIYPNGSAGDGIPGWANSTILESVPNASYSGGLVLSSFRGTFAVQTGNARSTRLTISQDGRIDAANLIVNGVAPNTPSQSHVRLEDDGTNAYLTSSDPYNTRKQIIITASNTKITDTFEVGYDLIPANQAITLLGKSGTYNSGVVTYLATDTAPGGVSVYRPVMDLMAEGTALYSYGARVSFEISKVGNPLASVDDVNSTNLRLSARTNYDSFATSKMLAEFNPLYAIFGGGTNNTPYSLIVNANTAGEVTMAKFLNGGQSGSYRNYMFLGKTATSNDCGWFSFRQDTHELGFGIYGATEQFSVGAGYLISRVLHSFDRVVDSSSILSSIDGCLSINIDTVSNARSRSLTFSNRGYLDYQTIPGGRARFIFGSEFGAGGRIDALSIDTNTGNITTYEVHSTSLYASSANVLQDGNTGHGQPLIINHTYDNLFGITQDRESFRPSGYYSNTAEYTIAANGSNAWRVGGANLMTLDPTGLLSLPSGDNIGLTLGPNNAYNKALFIGGWESSGASINARNGSSIQVSNGNLHIDSYGANSSYEIYMNYYSPGHMNLAIGGGNVGIGLTGATATARLHVLGTFKSEVSFAGGDITNAEFLNNAQTSTYRNIVILGKASTSNNSGYMSYILSTNSIGLGILGTSESISIATDKVTLNQPVILAQAASDPTGSNGMMYYDTANNRIRAYVNGAWKTVTVA